MPDSNGPREGTRNKLKNDPRDGGMSPPQQTTERFETGDTVHLKLDPSVQKGQYHPRFAGQTGTVVGQQGEAYRVEIVDGGKEKTLISRPAHIVAAE